MTPFNLCIIIPVYNHAQAIRNTVTGIRKQIRSPLIILVNDGSDDNCSNVLREIAINIDDIVLIEQPGNRGKGSALKVGLMRAAELGYSHGLQLDADGQHDFDDIQRFIDRAKLFPEAMIIGVAVFDDSISPLRYYARYLTHFWVWINTLSFQLKDSMCGFRVYPISQTNELICTTRIGDRMDYDVEVLVRWFWQRREVQQIDTRVIYPRDGISHFRFWQDNALITKMHAKLFLTMLIQSPQILWRRFGK